MDLITQIIAAIGGGVFATLIGGTNAFVLTGLTGIVAVAIQLAGGGVVFLNAVPAGALFGPHVAFNSGCFALALYAKMNKDIDGTDVFMPLFPNKPLIPVLVGGLVGAISHALFYLFSVELGLTIDNIALIIVIFNLIARLFIGQSGLFPGYSSETIHEVNRNLFFDLFVGFAIAAVSAYVSLVTGSNLIMFYISAFSLIMISFNRNIPATHHITLVSSYAAIQTGNFWLAIVFGLISVIGFEYLNPLFNKKADTFMETSTVMIAILSFVIFTFF